MSEGECTACDCVIGADDKSASVCAVCESSTCETCDAGREETAMCHRLRCIDCRELCSSCEEELCEACASHSDCFLCPSGALFCTDCLFDCVKCNRSVCTQDSRFQQRNKRHKADERMCAECCMLPIVKRKTTK